MKKNKSKELLVVVDMQNDFIDGSLGTKEAQEIVDNVCMTINNYRYNDIAVTLDTHSEDYLETQEGKNLPVKHCVYDAYGHEINESVKAKLNELSDKSKKNIRYFSKGTFGSIGLAKYIKAKKYKTVTLIGLCSDICVISNALLIKSFCPETKIRVLEWCTAGVNPESHNRAIEAMKVCQIEIVYKEDENLMAG